MRFVGGPRAGHGQGVGVESAVGGRGLVEVAAGEG